MGKLGDRETGRPGDRETGRPGDRETGRLGDPEPVKNEKWELKPTPTCRQDHRRITGWTFFSAYLHRVIARMPE